MKKKKNVRRDEIKNEFFFRFIIEIEFVIIEIFRRIIIDVIFVVFIFKLIFNRFFFVFVNDVNFNFVEFCKFFDVCRKFRRLILFFRI